MIDPERLVHGVLGEVFGHRPKRSKKAFKYLRGPGRSLWANPTTLLTAAGVAWGIVETLQGQSQAGGAAQGSQWGGLGGSPAAPAPGAGTAPGAPAGGSPVLPPLPQVGGATGVPSDALRLLRLAVSAAHADGPMNEQERAAILLQAKQAGVEEVYAQEIAQPRPLAEIVSGVADPAHRATLYVLAYTVLRADEAVTGAERIYLAQLAHLLGLDPSTVAALEKDTGDRIDALGDQGQAGG